MLAHHWRCGALTWEPFGFAQKISCRLLLSRPSYHWRTSLPTHSPFIGRDESLTIAMPFVRILYCVAYHLHLSSSSHWLAQHRQCHQRTMAPLGMAYLLLDVLTQIAMAILAAGSTNPSCFLQPVSWVCSADHTLLPTHQSILSPSSRHRRNSALLCHQRTTTMSRCAPCPRQYFHHSWRSFAFA